MREEYYILIGQTPVVERDLMRWAEWMSVRMGTDDRVVAQTAIHGGVVSTVFLGIDDQLADGPPLLFETMIFRDGKACEWYRCATWAEAEAQHAKILAECAS